MTDTAGAQPVHRHCGEAATYLLTYAMRMTSDGGRHLLMCKHCTTLEVMRYGVDAAELADGEIQ